jgi:DNA-binding response OmpR family regulator
MDILIIEDEVLLGLLVCDALGDVGHRVLGPAACRADALRLLSEQTPHLAFVDIELRGGESGIELAAELRRHGVACVFATGQPGRAREHRELALGLVAKPYNPTTIMDAVRYFEALHAGERLARAPRGLELFGPDRLAGWVGRDSIAPVVIPRAHPNSVAAAPAAALATALPPQMEQRLGDASVLEAVTG